MEKLSKELVTHVANLARLEVDEKEFELYQTQLADILTEIDKIINVEVNTEQILIAPTTNVNCYSNDVEKEMLSKGDIMKNVKNTNGDYIIVPRVLND